MNPQAVVYVSRTCGGCQQFLRLMASSPKLLRAIDVKILDRTTAEGQQAILDMHNLRANLTPTMVVFDQNGQYKVYQGAQATQALIAMA